jgi:hypothetical protein
MVSGELVYFSTSTSASVKSKQNIFHKIIMKIK